MGGRARGACAGRRAPARSFPARAGCRWRGRVDRGCACSTSAAARATLRQSLVRDGAEVVAIDVAEEPLAGPGVTRPLTCGSSSLKRSSAPGGCELRRGVGRRDDRARRRHRAVALRGAPRVALGWDRAIEHPRPRAAVEAASRAEPKARSRPISTHAPTTCASTPEGRSPSCLATSASRRSRSRAPEVCRGRVACCWRAAGASGSEPGARTLPVPRLPRARRRATRAQRLHVSILDRDRLGVEVHGCAQLAHGFMRGGGQVVLPEREPRLGV